MCVWGGGEGGSEMLKYALKEGEGAMQRTNGGCEGRRTG